jgi:hypothetical protein
MIDTIVYLSITIAILAAWFPAYLRVQNRKRRTIESPLNKRLAEYQRAPIMAEVRQTPEWWDGEFHKLLLAVGAAHVEHDRGEWITEVMLNGDTFTYEVPPKREYMGCPCRECRVLRRMR